MKSPSIRAVVSYEPGSGFVFPEGEVPAPMPSLTGRRHHNLVGANHGTYSGVENRGIKIRDLVFDFIDSVRDARWSQVCDSD